MEQEIWGKILRKRGPSKQVLVLIGLQDIKSDISDRPFALPFSLYLYLIIEGKLCKMIIYDTL